MSPVFTVLDMAEQLLGHQRNLPVIAVPGCRRDPRQVTDVVLAEVHERRILRRINLLLVPRALDPAVGPVLTGVVHVAAEPDRVAAHPERLRFPGSFATTTGLPGHPIGQLTIGPFPFLDRRHDVSPARSKWLGHASRLGHGKRRPAGSGRGIR